MKRSKRIFFYSLFFVLFVMLFFFNPHTILAAGDGSIKIPGADQSGSLSAAGDLMHLLDTMIFTFGARILAGISVLAAGWNLKEQRFAMAIICIFGAIMMATVPMWVKNIFSIGGGSIFG